MRTRPATRRYNRPRCGRLVIESLVNESEFAHDFPDHLQRIGLRFLPRWTNRRQTGYAVRLIAIDAILVAANI